MPTLEHEVDLYYTEAGDGDAILFCHGAGGNAASWYNQFGEFARDYRCVAYDCRGFGRSTCTAEEFDGRRFGADAIALLDHLGIESAHFVCQSMGGWTGVRVALEHPDRVRKLVLSDTIGGIALQSGIDSIRTVAERVEDTRLSNAAVAPGFHEREPALGFLYAQISDFNRLPQEAVGGSLFDPETMVPMERGAGAVAADPGLRRYARCPLATVRAARTRRRPAHGRVLRDRLGPLALLREPGRVQPGAAGVPGTAVAGLFSRGRPAPGPGSRCCRRDPRTPPCSRPTVRAWADA